MDRRRLLRAGLAAGAAACLPVRAQAQRRLWRIGYHSGGSAQSNPGWLDAFRQGMSDQGWSEARHYVIDARYADGNPEAMARLARELVATQPDVLLTTASVSIKLLADATKTIPIVFTIATDPVVEGFVANFHRPGGNLTGLTTLTADVSAKRLQLLKDAFPAISHVVLFFQGNDDNSSIPLKEYEAAAARLNLRLTTLDLRHPNDIEPAFKRAAALRPDAFAIASGFMLNVHAKGMAEQILRAKLPSMASSEVLADAGILMAYTVSIPQNFRRAATYVDRILKGAKPGELPVEQPTKFNFVINARTAKALGLTISPSLLVNADRVIQ